MLDYRLYHRTDATSPSTRMKANHAITKVSRITGVSYGLIVGQGRPQGVVAARFMAAWMLRHTLHLSYAEIAIALRRADHSAAIHMVKRAEHMRQTDGSFLALSNRCTSTSSRSEL